MPNREPNDDELSGDERLGFDEEDAGYDGEPDDEASADADDVPVCHVCQTPIEAVYYEINGGPICEDCREDLEATLRGGSKISRVVRAFSFGTLAGIGGFAIYYGILAATKHEFIYISILVGLMVGAAVRKGSDHRGGWFYQLMAMFVTYSVIVASYAAVVVPKLVDGAQRQRRANQAQNAAVAAQPGVKAPAMNAPNADKPRVVPRLGDLLRTMAMLLVYFIGFLYALPILVGLKAPIGLLIIAVALWEAWKLNPRTRLSFGGPYHVNGAEDVCEGRPYLA